MKCCSKKIADSVEWVADSKRELNAIRYTLYAKKGFSLPEVAAALIILALVSSSVLTVYNRCIASAADSTLRRQAFWVARENMETLLSGDSVAEIVEMGNSDKYPQVQWQTTVETFYEPITARMWIQAICSAEYIDTAGDVQTVELTNWLTDLTKKDLLKIIEQKQKEKERLAEQDEIEQDAQKKQGEQDEPNEPAKEKDKEDEERICGYTREELMQMDVDQIVGILLNCDEF